MDIRIRLKVKNLLPSCEGRQVVPKKMSYSLGRGTERLCSVKYLFEEAKIAYNFLLLEESFNFLDGRSIHVQFS